MEESARYVGGVTVTEMITHIPPCEVPVSFWSTLLGDFWAGSVKFLTNQDLGVSAQS